jgi:hypothetical protein
VDGPESVYYPVSIVLCPSQKFDSVRSLGSAIRDFGGQGYQRVQIVRLKHERPLTAFQKTIETSCSLAGQHLVLGRDPEEFGLRKGQRETIGRLESGVSVGRCHDLQEVIEFFLRLRLRAPKRV